MPSHVWNRQAHEPPPPFAPTVVAVADCTGGELRPLVARMAHLAATSPSLPGQHARPRGPVEHWWPQPDGAVRHLSLLSRSASAHTVALAEVRGVEDETTMVGTGAWDQAVLAQASRVVLWITPTPTPAELDGARTLLRLAGPTAERWLVVRHPAGTARPAGMAALRAQVGADRVINVLDGSAHDMARASRLAADRGIGLALSGGGARGFAHIGAYRALQDADIPIDHIAGASVGAMIGVFIALSRTHTNLAAGLQELFGGVLDYTLPVIGLVKGERVAKHTKIATRGAAFEDCWLGLSCVTTDLTHSELAVHTAGAMDAPLRASVAIPGVFPPVPIGQHLHVDGGLLGNLPTDVVADTPGIGTVIGIDVAPPRGPVARGDDEVSRSGWAALARRVGRRRRYPGLSTVLIRSMLVGSKQRQAQGTTPVDLLLPLELKGVPLLDFSDVAGVAERGYRAAETLLHLRGLAGADESKPPTEPPRVIDLRLPAAPPRRRPVLPLPPSRPAADAVTSRSVLAC